MNAPISAPEALRPLDGRGEGKLQPVEARTVLALLPGTVPEGSSRLRLDALAGDARWDVAVPFLAFALPVREAVWWACMCVGWAIAAPTDPERAAILAAESWVRHSDEQARGVCLRAAKKCGSGSASSAVALAAHGARLGTTPSPLGNQWVATALRRALAAHDPAMRAAIAARFVERGCDVAAGGAGRFQTASFREIAA